MVENDAMPNRFAHVVVTMNRLAQERSHLRYLGRIDRRSQAREFTRKLNRSRGRIDVDDSLLASRYAHNELRRRFHRAVLQLRHGTIATEYLDIPLDKVDKHSALKDCPFHDLHRRGLNPEDLT